MAVVKHKIQNLKIYFPKPPHVKYNIHVAAVKHNKSVSLLASYFDPIIRKEHLYFGSPQIISV